MKDETALGDRDIADLLPWYENGRLSPADHHRVAAALGTDPALQRELGLVREEMVATIDVNEALGAPSRRAAEQFFSRLEASPRGRPRFSLVRYVADRLEALRPQTLAWGAMAALALLLAQAGYISHLATRGGGGATYQTASVGSEADAGRPVLLVAFVPSANAEAIQALLEGNGLTVVAGPAAGYYSVRVDGDITPSKVEGVVSRLAGRKDVIRSVMMQSPPD